MKIVSVLSFVLALGLSGCSTSGIDAIGKPHAENDQKHLVVHNETLANKVTISAMRTRTTAGQLEVSLTLKNLTSRDKNMQYRFSWFDKDQFEVEPESEHWEPVVLHGAAIVELRALAPNPSVTSYKLNVREQ